MGLGKQYVRVWIEPSHSQAVTLVSTNWAYRAEWNWFSRPFSGVDGMAAQLASGANAASA